MAIIDESQLEYENGFASRVAFVTVRVPVDIIQQDGHSVGCPEPIGKSMRHTRAQIFGD